MFNDMLHCGVVVFLNNILMQSYIAIEYFTFIEIVLAY